ncbi:hypothetical protein DI383_12670 [Flavobacteriaceae bacterium LYZ1037]|nr:hypothetical protein DI383_12670 [Flavobacteriaceae bacterium LYZ1037]
MQPTFIGIYKHITFFSILFSCVFQFQGFSQTTDILDSNFEEVLVNLNIDTNGLNGNILNTDAVGVFYLNVSGNDIHDLSGIEAFTSLKTLDCSLNNLEELNVSNNIHLEELNANDNELVAIDVSLNTKLEILKLSSNLLNTIDLTYNVDLESLSVDLNNLTTLNVINNSKLEFLGCYSNYLTTLNVTNNTKLKYLFANFNELTTLDLTQNNLLKTLSCSSNNLTEINLDNNPQLSYLDCRENSISSLDLSDCLGLKRLFVSNNLLTELNLSNHSNLLLLYARYNNLSALDISSNSGLRWIKCEGNNLSTVDFRNGNNSYISEFTMTENANLSCIFVDDAEAGYLSGWSIDATCAFVENEWDCEALSTTEVKEPIGFHMFPNPASDRLTISIDSQQADLEIYSINGQLLLSKPLTFGKNNIQLTSLSAGMYLVQITSENLSETKKLLLN